MVSAGMEWMVNGFDAAVTDFFATHPEAESQAVEAVKPKAEQPKRSNTKTPRPQLECDQCKKVFKKRYNLKVHQRSHTGETPLACTFANCTLKFKWRSSLINHLRYHAPGGMITPAKTKKSRKPSATKAEAEFATSPISDLSMSSIETSSVDSIARREPKMEEQIKTDPATLSVSQLTNDSLRLPAMDVSRKLLYQLQSNDGQESIDSLLGDGLEALGRMPTEW